MEAKRLDAIPETTNKKYFKRIDLPDMGRLGLRLDPQCMSVEHKHSTMVISYVKPRKVSEYDALLKKMGEQSKVKIVEQGKALMDQKAIVGHRKTFNWVKFHIGTQDIFRRPTTLKR